MSQESQNTLQQQMQPVDDLQNLYIGRIVTTGEIVTKQGNFPASFKGEVLLYRKWDGQNFLIERVRRLALYGARLERPENDFIGVISLSGPLTPPDVKPDPHQNVIENLRFQLDYNEIPVVKPKVDDQYQQSGDALFPEFVEMKSTPLVVSVTEASEISATLEFERFELNQTDDKYQLQVIRMDHFTVACSLACTGQPVGGARCPLPQEACQPGMETCIRRLPIRFMNLSNQDDPIVANLCNIQADGVCTVWRNKAALELTIAPTPLTTQAQKNQFRIMTPLKIEDLAKSGLVFVDEIEVCVVDRLIDPASGGGGMTYKCGQAGAIVILVFNALAANNNQFLLSHELGHVLGIAHPNDPQQPAASQGSNNSVMVPSVPDSERNTLRNCNIFTGFSTDPTNFTLYSAIVVTTPVCDCFRPDPEI